MKKTYDEEVIRAYLKGRQDVEEKAARIIRDLQAELAVYKNAMAKMQRVSSKTTGGVKH